MIYRDKTFCPFKECRNFSNCDRALTNEVKKGAEKWGNANYGMPVIAAFKSPPKECYLLGPEPIGNE